MNGRKWSLVGSCLISCLFAAGCPLGDPVRTTSQLVRLRVADSQSGEPAAFVDVSLKVDFDTAFPLSEETLQPPKEWHQHKREFWKSSPWFRGATDQGQEGSEAGGGTERADEARPVSEGKTLYRDRD
jgi:hypothetical protein